MVIITSCLLFVGSVILIAVAISNQRKSHLNWYDFRQEFARGQASSDFQHLNALIDDDLRQFEDNRSNEDQSSNLPAIMHTEGGTDLARVVSRLQESVQVMAENNKEATRAKSRASDVRDWTMAGFGIAGTTVAGKSIIDWLIVVFELGAFP